MLVPEIVDERASGVSRVPSHSGQAWKVTARSTKRRTCGCIASGSLDSIDFWILGMMPSKVRLIPSTLILVGGRVEHRVALLGGEGHIGLSIGSPMPENSRPYQPSIEYPGTSAHPR